MHRIIPLIVFFSVIGCSGPNAEDEFSRLVAYKEQRLKSLNMSNSRIDNVQSEVRRTGSSTTPYEGILTFNNVLEVDATKYGSGIIRVVLGWKAHYVFRDGRWVLKSAEREVEDMSGRRTWREPRLSGEANGDQKIYEVLSKGPG